MEQRAHIAKSQLSRDSRVLLRLPLANPGLKRDVEITMARAGIPANRSIPLMFFRLKQLEN
jgi:hypothetical protein